MTKHYDYIAIGGGSGGIASINRAAMYGQKCALIEAKELGGKKMSNLIDATVGRLIFNEPIPQDLGYVDRSNSENLFNLEVSFLVGKKQLGQIIEKCIKVHGTAKTAEVLDKIKAQGFKYSTRGAITVAVCDAVIPPQKKELLAAAEENIEKITRQYKRGLISNDER